MLPKGKCFMIYTFINIDIFTFYGGKIKIMKKFFAIFSFFFCNPLVSNFLFLVEKKTIMSDLVNLWLNIYEKNVAIFRIIMMYKVKLV